MFEKVLNMPLVLISTGFWLCFWFWMCQSFGDTRVLYMPLDLNMQRFWIYQSSEYRVQNMHISWLFLNMPDFVCIYLNMPKHAWICLKLRECFCFIFSLWLHYITRGYLFEGLQETKFEFAATFRSRGEGGLGTVNLDVPFLCFFFLVKTFEEIV